MSLGTHVCSTMCVNFVLGAQGYYVMFEVSLRNFDIVPLCPPLVFVLDLHINDDGDVLRDLRGEGITIAPGSGVEE